ncbi:MAG: hypothetical protein GY866_27745 [Proteobacteria bacterium]|nr:hypothetical protein [Pseudomonadota bacterium]
MFDVTIYMNSDMEEILDFKCCNLADQNLEIHIHNRSKKAVKAPSYFVLKNDEESLRVDNLYPPWEILVEPESSLARYCTMDENTWARFKTLSIFDAQGEEYCFPIPGA